jgi:hypothetical protein
MEQAIALISAIAVAFGPLAAGVTKLVDTLRNLFDRTDTAPKWTWNIAALVISLAVCLGFQLDVVTALMKQVPALVNTDLSDVAGQILTAIGVAGFAAYWHEKMDTGISPTGTKAPTTRP